MNRIPRSRLLGGIALALAALVPAAHAQAGPGDLDKTFGGGDGTVEVSGPSPATVNPALALALDGTIALAGTSFNPPDYQGLVWRIDSSGRHVVQADPLPDFELHDVAFQPDGKLLVAGRSGTAFAVARLRADGQLDSTYAGDGVYESAASGFAVEIALDAEGRAVVAGTAAFANELRVERIGTDGSLLSSFASGGTAVTTTDASAVALQDDGRVLVAGSLSGRPGLLRLTPALAADPTFTPNLARVGFISDIAVRGDGRILLGTFGLWTESPTDPSPVLAQLLPDGGVDPKFNSFTLRSIDGPYYVGSMATEPSGRVLFTGEFLGRALPGGALDPSFAAGGLDRSIGATELKLQSDGKILLAHNQSGNGPTLTLSRRLSGSVRCGGRKLTRVGTAKRDTIRGTRRADVISAMGGSDRVFGLRGNDVICGGAGRDRLVGGAGRDRLLGGKGNDTLVGGKGRDRELQ